MYVCICNKVTDKHIHQAASSGVCTMDSLCDKLKVGTCCGKCKQCAKKVLHEALNSHWQVSVPVAAFQPA